MKTELLKLSKLKANPNNPRIIKDDKFEKLVKSIKEFPKMLEIRPIVVNDDMIVLGGNMRLKACKEAGLKEVPVIKASDLNEDEQRQFIIKDNVSGGEWEWEMLSNEWDVEQLEDWGLEVWQPPAEVDYSILDEEDDLDSELEQMTAGVKKAIQIEFNQEHYDEAYELVKFWREQSGDVGLIILEHLRSEKNKI